MLDPGLDDAHLPRADPKHAVPHLLDGDPEAGLLRPVVVAADRRRRIAEYRHVEEICGADIGGAEAVPPGGDEGAPTRALAVGGLHHLVEIAEKAVNARDLEHAAHDMRPVLEGADAARPARFSGGDPKPGRA